MSEADLVRAVRVVETEQIAVGDCGTNIVLNTRIIGFFEHATQSPCHSSETDERREDSRFREIVVISVPLPKFWGRFSRSPAPSGRRDDHVLTGEIPHRGPEVIGGDSYCRLISKSLPSDLRSSSDKRQLEDELPVHQCPHLAADAAPRWGYVSSRHHGGPDASPRQHHGAGYRAVYAVTK